MYDVSVAVRQRAAITQHPPDAIAARLLLEAPPVHGEEIVDDLGAALSYLALQRPPPFDIPKILPEARPEARVVRDEQRAVTCDGEGQRV